MPDPATAEPERPALRVVTDPVHVDLARVVLVGMALWLVGGIVTLVLAATGHIAWDAVWVCAVGLALGGVGLDWTRRHRG